MWNGAFSFQKTIGIVRFVPLSEMTPEQWRILEYENLRETAKNRIADMIVAGELLGFFHVHLTEKAKGPAKPDYFWPADKSAVDEFRDNNSKKWFRHEPDTDLENASVEKVDALAADWAMILTVVLPSLILREVAVEASEEEIQREIEKSIETGNIDNLTRPDAALILAIWTFKTFSTEAERESFMEELSEQTLNNAA